MAVQKPVAAPQFGDAEKAAQHQAGRNHRLEDGVAAHRGRGQVRRRIEDEEDRRAGLNDRDRGEGDLAPVPLVGRLVQGHRRSPGPPGRAAPVFSVVCPEA